MNRETKAGILLAIQFLGLSHGVMAKPTTEGAEFFSPVPGTRGMDAVKLVGAGRVAENGLRRIHMVSLKRFMNPRPVDKTMNQFDRIQVQSHEIVGRQRAAWWSFPILEYSTQEEAQEAMRALIDTRPEIEDGIFTFDEVREVCNNLINNDPKMKNAAQATLKLLDTMEKTKEGEDRTPSYLLAGAPLRFHKDCSFFLIAPSSAPNDEYGFYTNVTMGRRARGPNTQDTSGGMSEMAVD